MNTTKYVLVLFTFIAMQGIAQEQKTLAPSNIEGQENNMQSNTKGLNDTIPKRLSGSLFVRMPSMVDYNFKQKSIYYTPMLMGGFGLMYDKFYFEIASFADKNDNYGFDASLIYSLRVKSLDENWFSTTGIIGEVSYYPTQHSNPDLWIYTAGLTHLIFRPYKWGTPAIGFLLGGAYMSEEIHLNARVMLNLSIPLF